MILFRARQYGKAEWTTISIHDPAAEEEEEGSIEAEVASMLGSALDTSPLHVQKMNDEGVWEDLE